MYLNFTIECVAPNGALVGCGSHFSTILTFLTELGNGDGQKYSTVLTFLTEPETNNNE